MDRDTFQFVSVGSARCEYWILPIMFSFEGMEAFALKLSAIETYLGPSKGSLGTTELIGWQQIMIMYGNEIIDNSWRAFRV